MLPVSLFGMSISAAELPAMSSAVGTDEQVAGTLRQRIAASTKRVGFFVVPSAVGFIALGDVITAAIYQTGKFHHADAVEVWTILAGSGVGLVASTVGRLYSSAYYALRDTRTPVRFAIVRVILTTVLGYLLLTTPATAPGVDPFWGAAGLTASAGFAGWVEFTLLRRGMNLQDRTKRVPCVVSLPPMAGGDHRRGSGVGSEAGIASTKADHRRLADSCALRSCLSGLHRADGSGAGWRAGEKSAGEVDKREAFAAIPSETRDQYSNDNSRIALAVVDEVRITTRVPGYRATSAKARARDFRKS